MLKSNNNINNTIILYILCNFMYKIFLIMQDTKLPGFLDSINFDLVKIYLNVHLHNFI